MSSLTDVLIVLCSFFLLAIVYIAYTVPSKAPSCNGPLGQHAERALAMSKPCAVHLVNLLVVKVMISIILSFIVHLT